ncbi:hypothetical protein HDA40_000601 [Hamadaea flava]|uniref:PH domain-containing protein n=1 Tax=Hamadaea flava TaxID=1742688 RepID=A0ABV8LYR0_9ACTN|nr:hypothetical protein [Hamadaea flava]MCP2322094.1 hypothetical protein [Hamadaea flava]
MNSRTRAVTWTLVGALLLSLASGVVLALLSDAGPDRTTFVVVLLAVNAVAVLAGLTATIAGAIMLGSSGSRRRAGFIVTGRAFRIPPRTDLRLNGVLGILITGPLGGMMWRSPDSRGIAIAFVTCMAILIALILAVGPGPVLELRPTGVYWNARVFRRHIPWEALAPGGPDRPRPSDFRLLLIVTRPELVTQRGSRLGSGTAERPFLSLAMDVHPVFLADAIHWYADHPEDCRAIGTQAEHDRLRTALGAVPAPA